MPHPHLEARVRHLPGVALLDLEGEIHATADPVLAAAYTWAEGTNPPTIILNLSRVSYINSSGIALLVSLLAQARRDGRRMLAYGLSDHYKEILDITRLSEYLPVFPDEASALAEARPVTAPG